MGVKNKYGYSSVIKIWDMKTDQWLYTLSEHNCFAREVKFSPDGNLLAIGSDNKTAEIWDMKNGQCLQILSGHTDAVYVVAFSHDGKLLATGSCDKSAKIWELETGKCLFTLYSEDHVGKIKFSPNDKQLMTGGATTKIWDTKDGQCLKTFPKYTYGDGFSCDGKLLITYYDGHENIWSTEDWKCIQSCSGGCHFDNRYGRVCLIVNCEKIENARSLIAMISPLLAPEAVLILLKEKDEFRVWDTNGITKIWDTKINDSNNKNIQICSSLPDFRASYPADRLSIEQLILILNLQKISESTFAQQKITLNSEWWPIWKNLPQEIKNYYQDLIQ
jgi:hypothetical protein